MHNTLCIDMAGAPSYDAMGLAAMLNVRSMAEEAGERVRLINPTGQVAHGLHRTGIYDQLTKPPSGPLTAHLSVPGRLRQRCGWYMHRGNG